MAEAGMGVGDRPLDTSIRFFEDRHIDAQMRGLIPKFAYLAIVLIVATAPFLAPTWPRRWVLIGDALLALAVTEAVARSGLLYRSRPRLVYGLLSLYVVQLAVSGVASAHLVTYGVLQILPIVFAAAFFSETAARYSLPVVAAVADFVVARPVGDLSLHVTFVRMLCLLAAAHFGVAISDILREALRTHHSLHSVLEAASEAVDEDTLVRSGLSAALSVVRWDAGAVALTDALGGDGISIAGAIGVGEGVARHYESAPLRRDDHGLAAEVLRTGQLTEEPDVRRLFGPGHPLVRDGIVAAAGTPIPYHGERIGVLLTFHRRTRALDDRERDRLNGVAEQLGLALGSARAHRREAEVVASLRELNRRKDAFLAAVSHELRTPATTIELASRTLQRAGDRLSPEERFKVRNALVDRSRDLRELIEALLDVALTESGESRLLLEPVQWCSSLHRWVAELEERLGRPIELVLPPQEVESYADPAKLERVLFALVSNAVKFSLEDTPVRVAMCAEPEWIRIDVSDEGMGILPGDVERIFDRFLQLDDSTTRQVGGLGIGLTLVRHFTRLHGGRVDVESEAGKGSTFTVTIPVVHELRA